MKQIDAAIGIIVRDGKILICQRREGDFYGGYWEFPGGKCEPGESPETCLHRELQEEIDLRVSAHRAFSLVEFEYPGKLVRLHPFLCRHIDGEPKLIACQAAKWIDPEELLDHDFPPANENLIDEVIRTLGRRYVDPNPDG